MLARPGDARARARGRAAARAGRAEDGALLLPRRDEHARLRVGLRGAGRARPAAAPGRGARGAREPRGRRVGLPSVLDPRGAADRRRAAVPGDARGARADREGPARLRPARPRRDGELRRVPPRARRDPALACGRARPVGELAVPRRARRPACSRRGLPGCGGCLAAGRRRPCATVADWEADVAAAGVDYTRIWWDARPHPRLGTLEVRIADQATSVDRAAAVVALVQALCAAPPRDSGARPLDCGSSRRRGSSARWELVETLREPPEALRQLEVGRRRAPTAVAADLVSGRAS